MNDPELLIAYIMRHVMTDSLQDNLCIEAPYLILPYY